MDRVYALGISVIEFIQNWFVDYDDYFRAVNNLSNPHHVLEIMFPVVSMIDSVFAAQLLLCMSFGGWLNSVMKWWMLEDRPYWWVRETSFYSETQRPQLRQTNQTCETGPGCPSGHSATTAMILLLGIMWMSHVMNDRKLKIWWWKQVVYPLFAMALGSVMLARMYVATHFPHQCLIGALVGSFLAPALCIYVSDPYIWGYGAVKKYTTRSVIMWHVFSCCVTIAISFLTYWSLVLCGWDPMWTVKLAFKWCEQPESIHVSTSPMFALVESTGHLLGWALSVTPAVAQYRHYTRNRSLILSLFTTALIVCGVKSAQESLCKDNAWRYYAMQFLICAIKPGLLLRFAPAVATWPYITTKSKKA